MAITLGPRPTSPGADIYLSRKAVMGRAGRRRALALVHMGRAFGRTLGHELAHRFLKSGHSERGILRATFSQRDLIDADVSDMFFTAEQIELLEEIAGSRE